MGKLTRNSSIELLRIIAMIGVVLLHYNNPLIGNAMGLVNSGSPTQYFLYFIETLFICAVNLYVMISAYFLSQSNNRKFSKIVELFIQVILFNVAIYSLKAIINQEFSVVSFFGSFLPINYFLILYSVVYILSPYINLMLDKLSAKGFKNLVILSFVIFSVWTIGVDVLEEIIGRELNGLSTIGMYGSQKGYSIINFMLVYLVGAYIGRVKPQFKCSTLLISLFTVLALNYGWALLELNFANGDTAFNYNNPLVIIIAAIILMLFLKMNFENKIINELAKGTFTCFLIHNLFFRFAYIEKVIGTNVFFVFLHMIAVGVVFYLISYLVYKIYHLIIMWPIKKISPFINKLSLTPEIENTTNIK